MRMLLLCSVLVASSFADAEAKRKPVLMADDGEGLGRTWFAIYDDGLVIFRAPGGAKNEYRTVTLAPKERKKLVASLGLAQLAKLKASYDVPRATETQETRLSFWVSGKRRVVRVRGIVAKTFDMEVVDHPDPTGDDDLGKRAPEEPPFRVVKRDNGERKQAPQEFLAAYDVVAEYQHPSATPWSAEKIHLVLSPSTRAAEVKWPSGWPGLKRARKDAQGNYHLEIAGEKIALVNEVAWRSVTIGGKVWSVGYEVVLPGR